nr:MAG TPA: hypothetical protein [Caudoviricetes sp.]
MALQFLIILFHAIPFPSYVVHFHASPFQSFSLQFLIFSCLFMLICYFSNPC